jgi:Protein of unknown function (DUF3043)
VIFGRKHKDDIDDSATAAGLTNGPENPTPGYTPPKGAPTPKRSSAQAQRKARVAAPKDRKAAAKELREKRATESVKVRQAMSTGDDRYLPARDKGPVRRAVRDLVDSRLMFSELVMPIMLVMLIVLVLQIPNSQVIVSNAWLLLLLVVLVDLILLSFRIRRMLRTRFADQPTKGALAYGLLRATQVRPLRLPKTQVRIGGGPKTRKSTGGTGSGTSR